MLSYISVEDVLNVEKFIILVNMTYITLTAETKKRPAILCNYHGSASLTNWISVNFFVPTVIDSNTLKKVTIGYEPTKAY